MIFFGLLASPLSLNIIHVFGPKKKRGKLFFYIWGGGIGRREHMRFYVSPSPFILFFLNISHHPFPPFVPSKPPSSSQLFFLFHFGRMDKCVTNTRILKKVSRDDRKQIFSRERLLVGIQPPVSLFFYFYFFLYGTALLSFTPPPPYPHPPSTKIKGTSQKVREKNPTK